MNIFDPTTSKDMMLRDRTRAFKDVDLDRSAIRSKLESVENGHTETRTFFVLHLDEGNTVSLACFVVNWNFDVWRFYFKLLLFKRAFNQGDKFSDLVFFALWQVVYDEIVREVVVELWRVLQCLRIYDGH